MKDFDSFLSSISTEDYNNIKSDVLSSREPVSLTDAIPEISYQIALRVLKLYHEWSQD